MVLHNETHAFYLNQNFTSSLIEWFKLKIEWMLRERHRRWVNSNWWLPIMSQAVLRTRMERCKIRKCISCQKLPLSCDHHVRDMVHLKRIYERSHGIFHAHMSSYGMFQSSRVAFMSTWRMKMPAEQRGYSTSQRFPFLFGMLDWGWVKKKQTWWWS